MTARLGIRSAPDALHAQGAAASAGGTGFAGRPARAADLELGPLFHARKAVDLRVKPVDSLDLRAVVVARPAHCGIVRRLPLGLEQQAHLRRGRLPPGPPHSPRQPRAIARWVIRPAALSRS